MTTKIIIKNDEGESSPHKVIIGVLSPYSEDFIEKHILEPTEEISIHLYAGRTLVVSELPVVATNTQSGAPVSPVLIIPANTNEESRVAA